MSFKKLVTCFVELHCSSALGFAVLISTSTIYTSCSYDPPSGLAFCIDSTLLDHKSINIIENINENIVVNDSLQIVHGHVIARDKFENGINVFLQLQGVDRRHNKATVILNGWNLKYTGKSRQVEIIGASVGNIKLTQNLLTWNAVGILRDQDTREIEGEFFYTIILWDSGKLSLVTDEGNLEDLCKNEKSGGNSFYGFNSGGFTTAHASKITSLKLAGFPSRGLKAVLPRGFLMRYTDDEIAGGRDHNLLQLAYQISGVATTDKNIEPRRMVDSTYVSWRSDFIMKDNEYREDAEYYESIATIAGSGIGYISPPFSILPAEDPDFGTGCFGSADSETKNFRIENIPFQYAIPLLTGWDLQNFCGDRKIKSIGVRIKNWTYGFDVNSALGGNLNYELETTLINGSGNAEMLAKHHVSVLGLVDITKSLK